MQLTGQKRSNFVTKQLQKRNLCKQIVASSVREVLTLSKYSPLVFTFLTYNGLFLYVSLVFMPRFTADHQRDMYCWIKTLFRLF